MIGFTIGPFDGLPPLPFPCDTVPDAQEAGVASDPLHDQYLSQAAEHAI
jgi:hypothetical protein